MACNFCKTSSHSTTDHICGQCKQKGHPGYIKHCSRCLALDHDSDLHTCMHNKCKRLDTHNHTCQYCSDDHTTEKHMCDSCKQEGHASWDCQKETVCTICNGKVGHFTSLHHFCDGCKQDVFTRHIGCPTDGCNGCAAETHPPMIWYEYYNSVKCNTCNRKWDDLDCVAYEWMGKQLSD
ncbi:hypothetical protein Klosneuvirus_1_320 [Klosneuvirus KNV1]|uniref:Uncharacterized protein n=1 Tax=Klosneuvirus KNV1 TaxID=1977640 RepID=A0A1V0SIB5_9VIRU|nr:hypothetical protein Klosneuvirus_1_320 [Klosneuvirus KNV1]